MVITSLKFTKKQFLILIFFSFLSSIFAIAHGMFFDLEWSQIGRISLEGVLLTFIVIFPALIFLEWLFDINNKKKFDELEKRVKKLEKRK